MATTCCGTISTLPQQLMHPKSAQSLHENRKAITQRLRQAQSSERASLAI